MNNKQPKTDLVKLRNLYLNTDLNLKEIGSELDVSFAIVKKWIKYLGIHRTSEHEMRVQKRKYKIRENNLIEKYGVDNVAKLPEVKEKQKQNALNRWQNRSVEDKNSLVEKVLNTKQIRYGDKSYNNISKCKQTKLERYGDENYNNQIKNNETRSKNRTSGKSKTENQLFESLISKYGKHNIQRQYKTSDTSRLHYDFKINNLLLELNGLFWHNYRPYSNTDKDKKEYYSLKQRGGVYKAIAKHWKYDDVRKLNYCINNNINFLAIYFDTLPENILELIEKYKVGQTILIYRDNKLTVQRLSKSDN